MSGYYGFPIERFTGLNPAHADAAPASEAINSGAERTDPKQLGLLFASIIIYPLLKKIPTAPLKQCVGKAIRLRRPYPAESTKWTKLAPEVDVKIKKLRKDLAVKYHDPGPRKPGLTKQEKKRWYNKSKKHRQIKAELSQRINDFLLIKECFEHPDRVTDVPKIPDQLFGSVEEAKEVSQGQKALAELNLSIQKDAEKYVDWSHEILACLIVSALLYNIMSTNANEVDVMKAIESEITLFKSKLETINSKEKSINDNKNDLAAIIDDLKTKVSNHSNDSEKDIKIKEFEIEMLDKAIKLKEVMDSTEELFKKNKSLEIGDSPPIQSEAMEKLKLGFLTSIISITTSQKDKLAHLPPLRSIINSLQSLKISNKNASFLVLSTALVAIQLASLKIIDPYQTTTTIDNSLRSRIRIFEEQVPGGRLIEKEEVQTSPEERIEDKSIFEEFQQIRESIPREYVDAAELLILELIDLHLEDKIQLPPSILKIIIKGVIETTIMVALESKYRKVKTGPEAWLLKTEIDRVVKEKFAPLHQILKEREDSISSAQAKFVEFYNEMESKALILAITVATAEPDKPRTDISTQDQ